MKHGKQQSNPCTCVVRGTIRALTKHGLKTQKLQELVMTQLNAFNFDNAIGLLVATVAPAALLLLCKCYNCYSSHLGVIFCKYIVCSMAL